jgi:hypothetical protein
MIQKLCSTENEQKITENMSKRKKEFTEEGFFKYIMK